jgi:hypothetical protein
MDFLFTIAHLRFIAKVLQYLHEMILSLKVVKSHRRYIEVLPLKVRISERQDFTFGTILTNHFGYRNFLRHFG